MLGIVIFPYLLGFFTAILHLSALRKPCFVKVSILVILYLFIELSWFNSVFNHTAPVVCLGFALPFAAILDARFNQRARCRSRSREAELHPRIEQAN